MGFAILPVLALFCLALVGSHASLPSKVYWQSVLPNTPMPKALQDSLISSTGQIQIPIPYPFFFSSSPTGSLVKKKITVAETLAWGVNNALV